VLASLNDVLPVLNERKVCLPALDIAGGQPDFFHGVLDACCEARCPALMVVWVGATYIGGLEACAEMARYYAAGADVPVILHLDHGTEADVRRALEAGFKSVMFDGSALPLEENIERTRAMVRLARERGAAIEGELGRFGRELGGGPGAHVLTDPEEAALFVRETGVDLLAPAVGNAHGFTAQTPRLRFDLIERIAAAGTPLSLHGGTGIPLSDVRRAGELGMRKINVASQIHRDYAEALRACADLDTSRQYSWQEVLLAGRRAIRDRALEYIRALGCEGLV